MDDKPAAKPTETVTVPASILKIANPGDDKRAAVAAYGLTGIALIMAAGVSVCMVIESPVPSAMWISLTSLIAYLIGLVTPSPKA